MSTPTSTPGRTIGGRYALLGTVGAGGMGTVWRAHDELLRRDVAVKEVLLPPGVPRAERQMLCERTLREARAAASLNNPSVVRIYDVVEEDDRPWIVMELVAARSLAEIIADTGPLPPNVVADVGLQVLGALEAAHAAGILHRDVKPGNILLSSEGRATLTDFGVARTSGDSALTSTGLLLGSPSYISPERARGGPAVPASDLWSLGATLYAAVEGRPPYDKGEPLQTLTAIVSDPLPAHTLAGPLRAVLMGLLDKEPEHRWDVRQARNGFRDALGISRADGTSTLAPGGTRLLNPVGDPVRSSGPPPTRAERKAERKAERQPERRLERATAWQATGEPPPWRPDHSPPAGRSRRRAPAPRRRGGKAGLAVALVLVLAGLATAGTYYATRDPSPGRPAASASPAAPTTPAGYFRFDHPAGFSIAIPAGWNKETLKPSGVIQFRDPNDTDGGGRFLRLQSGKTGDTIEEYWKAADARTKASLRGYQLVGIRASKSGSHESADWEFTHTVTADRHVVDRGFVLDGRVYHFYLSTREDQFASSTGILDTSSGSFALS